MKILHVIDIPWHSALAAYAFDQASALVRRGHGTFFAAPENSAAAVFARSNNFPLTLIPSRRSWMILGTVLKLKKLIETETIDVVSAHTGRAQSLIRLVSLLSSRPFALVRTKADAKRPKTGRLPGGTTLLIAGSGAIKAMYGPSAEGKIEVIRQGIAAPEAAAAPSGSTLKVGILGRLDPVKGHACFIEAAALVLKKFPGAEFLVAGREENIRIADLAKNAKDLGIGDKVKFLGHVPDNFAFMRSCDIGVIASLSSEAVSRAAVEWLAAGRPLVASAAGGLPEFAEPEWLVPPGNPAILAGKLLALLESAPMRLAAGAAGRAKVLRDYSPASFADRTEAAFRRAAERGTP